MAEGGRSAWWALLGCALLAFALGGCSDDDSAVVATVDGFELTEDDVLRSYVDYLITTGQNDTQALRQRHVSTLIDAYLLGAEAERRGLGADSVTVADERIARRQLLGSRYFETALLDTLAVPTEAEIRTAFSLSKEQRIVRHLYFTSEARANESYARLEDGRPFLEEAQELYETDDPSAGSLGIVGFWQLDDAFADAAFSTAVGAYSEPVRSRLGFHIVYVEDRIRNPLQTESDFERRRKGVESQLRNRRGNIEGDRYIRSFMEARNVAVNRPALLALQAAIDELEGDPLPDAQQGDQAPFSPTEQSEILESFLPQTPLATFEIDGQAQTFTLADYVFWLQVLPPSEARNRTGASLGRALRNEALARAGEASGIGDDPQVRHELARRQRLRLADRLRQQLRSEAATDGDTTRLAQIARDLRLDPRRTLADFWTVSFATQGAAQQALVGIRASPASASGRAGYRAYDEQDIATIPSLAAAVQGAPLGEVVLGTAGAEWLILQVTDRRVEAKGSGAEALAPFVAEADLLRRLHRERPVERNRQAFERVTTPPSSIQGRR